jgi:hypothetical protein
VANRFEKIVLSYKSINPSVDDAVNFSEVLRGKLDRKTGEYK